MTQDEIWKPIPSLPEYEASSLGRIRRVPHRKPMPYGGYRTYGGTPTYGTLAQDQWRYIYNYKGKNYKVHRLVCEAFNGPAPFEKAVVMHLDDDATNNKPENLAWGTQKQNLNAPAFIAYCKSRTGENSPTAKGKARRESLMQQGQME